MSYKRRYVNQLYQNAYENAYDCHYYGMGRSDWQDCGVRTQAKKDEIWKLAYYDCAEPDEEHGKMMGNKYHFLTRYGGDLHGNYVVLYSGNDVNMPVYKTLEEARAVCEEIRKRTGYILTVQETERKVTHKYVLDCNS